MAKDGMERERGKMKKQPVRRIFLVVLSVMAVLAGTLVIRAAQDPQAGLERIFYRKPVGKTYLFSSIDYTHEEVMDAALPAKDHAADSAQSALRDLIG